jgi:preprotein translocase subunit SecY
MLQALLNIFKVPDLRNRVLFTVAMLAVYRIGYWIPIPGVNQEKLAEFFEQSRETGAGFARFASYVATFTGGSFSQSTIFGLGIMPFITASIIFQLLASVYPPLKKKQDEGPSGRQQVQEWTRYATVLLCVVQAVGLIMFFNQSGIIYRNWSGNVAWWMMAITAMTAGTMFLMWLGEQIDKFGIGNGVSLIITASILTGMPTALFWVLQNSELGQVGFIKSAFQIATKEEPQLSWLALILLAGAFVFVVAGCVIMTVATRRIPIQQAKHTRGRKVFGGQRSYLPLRVNHGGVMPIIFASSLMIFPSVLLASLANSVSAANNGTGFWVDLTSTLATWFDFGAFPYILLYIAMVFFFSYFWTTVQFNPDDMAKQLREHGSFVPGLRPGPRTAEYLETVMERVTYVGAGFLAVIAVLPMVVQKQLGIDFAVANFLGGTGLMIVVSVGLDLIQRIEATLLMRNFAGFLGGDERGGPAPRIRGRNG